MALLYALAQILLLLVRKEGMQTGAVTAQSSGREGDPWLATRVLEIPYTAVDSDREGLQISTEFTVRFDALLIDPADLASRIRAAATTNVPNSVLANQSTSPAHSLEGLRAESDRRVVFAAVEALSSAADSVYDAMEEELVSAAARGVVGDWLEAADSTCSALTLQRRRDILELYSYGRMNIQSVACTQPGKEDSVTTSEMVSEKAICRRGATAEAALRIGLEGEWPLLDASTSLSACRAFFASSEVEYAKAACLRAVRLGDELSADDAVEIDMRLASIALRHGRPSTSVRLLYHVMGLPSTTDDGRLAMTIIGLTMVPPTLIGSFEMVAWFRKDWTKDLGVLRHNLLSGATKGQLRDPHAQIGITPFHLAHQGGPDLELMYSLAGVYDAAAPSLRFVAPHCLLDEDKNMEDARWTLVGRPARIGFFSVHLRDHSVGRMLFSVLKRLSERPDLEVHVFASGERMTGGDQVVDGLQPVVQHWHEVPNDLDSARTSVAEQKLDVLVYPDLGMEPLTFFMAFARLAPVQCVWWGHPVTPSTGAIDYFLSLDTELEGGQADYLEQMVRMEIINTAPFQQIDPISAATKVGTPPDDVQYDKHDSMASATTLLSSTTEVSSTLTQEEMSPPLLSRSGSSVEHRASYDFDSSEWSPPCRRTYVVLGRLFKLHPYFDAAIEGILARDPHGCVLLIHETMDEEWTRGVWRRLTARLIPQGLADRLRFVHHWLYPGILRRATAVLDTFPYGGCLTVLEGLSNGVPVVTLPAKFIRGRFALAMYRQMGYTDLVADDVEGYITLAVRLGMDEAFRKRATARVQECYRLSLDKNEQSGDEWAAFFRRALRAAGFDGVPR